MAAEYRVINKLLFAAIKEKPLNTIVSNTQPGFKLSRFRSIKKKRIYIDQEKSLEIDIYCESETEDGSDFVIEVKDWDQPPSFNSIKEYVNKKDLIDKYVNKKIGYIFYSEKGFTEGQIKLFRENGIIYTTGSLLD